MKHKVLITGWTWLLADHRVGLMFFTPNGPYSGQATISMGHPQLKLLQERFTNRKPIYFDSDTQDFVSLTLTQQRIVEEAEELRKRIRVLNISLYDEPADWENHDHLLILGYMYGLGKAKRG